MALRKIKLGSVMIPFKEKCGINNLTPYDISGVNRDKEFFEPSKQVGEDTSNYQNVPPKYFACNLMHVGRDVVLPIAYNYSEKIKRVSPAYSVFRIKENCELLDYYFFIYLKSNERDRMFWFNTDSSIRDGMTWDDFCNIEIEVPDLPTQEKFVKVYLSMLENQKAYERGLEDLKLVCDGYIEDLRRKMPCEEIGQYIVCTDRKTDDISLKIQGISNQQKLNDSNSRVDGVDTSKYLRIDSREFGYSPIHINDGSIAFNSSNESFLLSPIYKTFKVIDENKLLPEYLMMWFGRNEFIRYCTFHAFGSARDTFEWEQMCKVMIPIPNIEVQKSIINIYKCYQDRKDINDLLKNEIKDICPILIKGSIEEAKEA
jgi:type I restriction enzyme S subunit